MASGVYGRGMSIYFMAARKQRKIGKDWSPKIPFNGTLLLITTVQ
jgi:hypothetical protein